MRPDRKPVVRSDLTTLSSTRGQAGPLMYPGVWQRVWISIPGTGVSFLAAMNCAEERGGAA